MHDVITEVRVKIDCFYGKHLYQMQWHPRAQDGNVPIHCRINYVQTLKYKEIH